MAEHAEELVKELRRRNFQKKKALASEGKNVRERPAMFQRGKEKKKHVIIDEETAARSVVVTELKDLHEVASRVKGKK